MGPRFAGRTGAEIAAVAIEFSERPSPLTEQALLAMYHAHQAHAITGNTIDGFERALADAGLNSRLARPPAVCFLDITGYTRLTQESGDTAAADLADELGRLVQRTSLQYGGRPNQLARRRRHALLSRARVRGLGRPPVGRRRRCFRTPASARRPPCRSGRVSGRRLLRLDGQYCRPYRSLCAPQ